MSRPSPKDILRRELIGLDTVVVKDTCKDRESLAGKVVDETRNMITILQEGRFKKIPKAGSIFRFKLPSGDLVDVDGNKIIGRLEDRVKRRTGRRW
ncbi:MAG: ribonuclease P protein subunit [Candidatus Bathyarchaeia archaeon]